MFKRKKMVEPRHKVKIIRENQKANEQRIAKQSENGSNRKGEANQRNFRATR